MKFSLLLLLLIFSSFYGCFKKDPSSQDAGKKLMRLNLNTHVHSIDPAVSFDVVSADILYQCHEQLYQFDYLARPFKQIPALAEEMPIISEDKKTYTIKIKKGIFYHPDPNFKEAKREVKAQDFINQIKRLVYAPTKSVGGWTIEGKIEGIDEFKKASESFDLNTFLKTPVSGLVAQDDYTLILKLTAPYPQLKFILGMGFFSPIPEELILAYNNEFHNRCIGTGPFILTEFDSNSRITLKKNPNYRQEKFPTPNGPVAEGISFHPESVGKELPFLDEIQFTVMTESPTKVLNFMSGKTDLLEMLKDQFDNAFDAQGNLLPELQKKKVVLHKSPSMAFYFLGFNVKDPLFQGEKGLYLRKAIAHALDLNQYLQLFTGGIFLPMNGPVPHGVFGSNSPIQQKASFPYSLELAKEYLAKAGYPNGEGLSEIPFDLRRNDTLSRQTGEFFKSQLEKVGIKIVPTLNTFPGFLEKRANGKLKFFHDGWALDYPDPENSLQLLYSKNFPPGYNAYYFENPNFDKIYLQVAQLEDGPEKQRLIDEAKEIIEQEVPWIFLYNDVKTFLMTEKVKNFNKTEIHLNYFKYLDLL